MNECSFINVKQRYVTCEVILFPPKDTLSFDDPGNAPAQSQNSTGLCLNGLDIEIIYWDSDAVVHHHMVYLDFSQTDDGD